MGVIALVAMILGWVVVTDRIEATAPEPSVAGQGQVTAAETVAALPVKGRAPRTDYDRALFGQTWADVDRNGCDTRNDVLRRDLVEVVIKEGTQGCRVESGMLVDPYSDELVLFVRGERGVDIDHVVALSDAWQKGAQQWTPKQREAFANDPLNLLAISTRLNQQKGAGDAASWLPPKRAYRCAYVARQAAVKQRYGAWVTPAEQDAMLQVLHHCPNEPLPTG